MKTRRQWSSIFEFMKNKCQYRTLYPAKLSIMFSITHDLKQTFYLLSTISEKATVESPPPKCEHKQSTRKTWDTENTSFYGEEIKIRESPGQGWREIPERQRCTQREGGPAGQALQRRGVETSSPCPRALDHLFKVINLWMTDPPKWRSQQRKTKTTDTTNCGEKPKGWEQGNVQGQHSERQKEQPAQ